MVTSNLGLRSSPTRHRNNLANAVTGGLEPNSISLNYVNWMFTNNFSIIMINNKEGTTVQIIIARLSRLSLKGYPSTMRIN